MWGKDLYNDYGDHNFSLEKFILTLKLWMNEYTNNLWLLFWVFQNEYFGHNGLSNETIHLTHLPWNETLIQSIWWYSVAEK
jgi:hypothetical protein